MQTYRLFMKLVKRNLPSVIIYFGVFIAIAMVAGANGRENAKKIYQDTEIPFTVLNRDQSRLGEEIKGYLSGKNQYIEMEDDMLTLQNEMFYRGIYYVLVIPEGFEASVRNGVDMALVNYKVHDSAMGYYMDMMVDAYMRSLRAYLAAGMDLDGAMAQTGLALEAEADVMVWQDMEDGREGVHYYFQYLPYIFLSMIINLLGGILIAFNKEKVRMRTACSSVSFTKRNLQLALGTGVFGLAIWLVFVGMALVLYRGTASVSCYIASGLNSLCFALLSISISVMCGLLSRKTTVLAPIAVVISLGFCFLGGIFVPLFVMGEGIMKIAKFMPTYWYVTANDAIVKATGLLDAQLKPAWAGMGMQLLFAAGFFAVAVVAAKRQRIA